MALSLRSQRLEEERRERLDNVLWDRALQEIRHPTTPQSRMHLARSLLGVKNPRLKSGASSLFFGVYFLI